MTAQTWTDNCPRCDTTCAPRATNITGDQRSDTYRCRCGRSWTTTRSISGYEGFDGFAPVLPRGGN